MEVVEKKISCSRKNIFHEKVVACNMDSPMHRKAVARPLGVGPDMYEDEGISRGP